MVTRPGPWSTISDLRLEGLQTFTGTAENGNRGVSSVEQRLRNKLRERIGLLKRFTYCKFWGRRTGPSRAKTHLHKVVWICTLICTSTKKNKETKRLRRWKFTAVAAAAPAMIFRVLRRSTVVVIVIVRNRSCDATAPATVQYCRCSSSQPHASSLALAGTRGTTAATVQRHSSSQAPAPSLALAGTRGTTATTVQRRSSSQAPAPSLALAGTRGTLATIHHRWMLDLRITLRRGKRSGMLVWTTEQSNDCHGGPVPEVSGPPEATAPLVRGGLPLQARHQRRLQPPSGTLSSPTAAISDSAFER